MKVSIGEAECYPVYFDADDDRGNHEYYVDMPDELYRRWQTVSEEFWDLNEQVSKLERMR